MSRKRSTQEPDVPLMSDQDEQPFEQDEIKDVLTESDLDIGEDLFASDHENDYKLNSNADKYNSSDIDDRQYDDIDFNVKKLVDLKLNKRDNPRAFDESDDDQPLLIRRRRNEDNLDIDDDDVDLPIDELSNVKGKLVDWVKNAAPRLLIRKLFKRFLITYKDIKGVAIYGIAINRIGEGNSESLQVSFVHLEQHTAILSYYVSFCPIEVLQIFDEVAMEAVVDQFEDYERIQSGIHVRITDLPVVEALRDLRQTNLNTLIRVSGVVTKRTGVFPQLKYVKFDCIKCGALLGPFYQEPSKVLSIGSCPGCSSKSGFRINSEQTVYRNYQKITLQETPGSVPAGRLPRHREVVLLWDLVDSARPGEEIEVTGVYRNNMDICLNSKNGFPVFATVIEANHIFKKEDQFASFRLNEQDNREIMQLSKQPNIVTRIVKSIAPSIYGHEDIKRALALAMFGGVPKNPQGKHRVRGDINVLLLGDPGTAKSQFLKYVEKTAHRAVYATGQGASAVGLTAAVHKDPITKEWTLEGGALVMADKGICMIDEFDKMNDQDRTSIHEAMEQQSISISKAGIITTLQARCAVIAAANPIRGRYNPQIPFSANVELTEPILSRFDILCVVRDTANPVVDEHLARFVCNSHMKSHPEYDEEQDIAMHPVLPTSKDVIPQDLLRKYIMFARSHYEPRISETDEDKLARFYADLRKESLASGAIPITVRYLESMIRMAESFAKMQLHDSVSQADIDRAISVMVKSFVSTQKIGAQRALEKYLKKYMSFAEDSEELLSYILSDMMNDEWKFYYFNKQKGPDTLEIDVKLFSLRASDYGIDDLTMFLKSALFKSTFRLDANRGVIIKDMRASGEGRADGGVSSSQIYEDEEMDFVGSQV